ncbi:MAG: bifunctional diguanylate cyclase/phosphodiesterase [Sulfurimonas sp.]|uniref:bifunctional diguanylate cyclase/phosphodiesterase n=1 Tax=Sulfurimonas sp. TaxID=2022749 RepID=UPI00262E57C9|nr:bifunctional diguanylate cyclase/phosphodiesterase [Sulfurimonas sp.]MCW8895032.1 bifunctional diguanylate cyclase/phosphodiesterase [Sulfurimonas sp.]MCW8953636.1 bifunctional diguanylate cyclase/phosphodiesterase [Sulfurimonas sp.]MCW9067349.1 bifunctional diguanylate cyclase/phosphodiesterase [Sulfurimonas sp.]
MPLNSDILEIKNFTLTSSTAISAVIDDFEKFQEANVLVHIVSVIHNTVLVQNLKNEIKKVLPNAKVVLLKHNDRTNTNLTIYNIKKNIDVANINDEILNELYKDSSIKDASIAKYRNKLFSRYFTDHLTNLPNVYKLRNDLEEHEDYALVIFNIDNFQTINNFYGFMVGDYVIEKVGKYLKENIPESDIYRLSGDEFAFVLNRDMGFYELKEYLNNLHSRINNIVVEYQGINIYVNFTLASCTNKDRDNKNIFSKVAMALKYAKETGELFWIYEDKMNFENEYERNLKLSGIVREAVENSKIIPYYQAIVDTKTYEVKKYECLARLVDKNEKILSPLLFIPVAKNIKLYNEITKIIINKSFETFKDNDFEFSINLSIDDIMSHEIFSFIINKLKNSESSHRVIFELLESDAIEDFKKVERFISEVKRCGAKIAIDDFGSGYSNFAYLTKMSADFIKIDGALIRDMDVDNNAYIVVETIVSFAKRLGIKTIAEYVHSSTVMDKVKELEIDYCQGFYLDEPSISLGNGS